MNIKQVIKPIQEDMHKFEQLLNEFLKTVPNKKVQQNYTTFFKVPGKYLRPALLMLGAGAPSGNKKAFDKGLYRLALILELLHSASLVHDDIVDEDISRRGKATVNQVFGNNIAVLTGDTLFSYAFKEAAIHYEKKIIVPITTLAFDMCMGELEQANGITSKESYLRVITKKTAQFMAIACELGAIYAGESEPVTQQMKEIGLHIGMTYQMMDDRIDGNLDALKYITKKDIKNHYLETEKLIHQLKQNSFTESLLKVLNYMYSMEDN